MDPKWSLAVRGMIDGEETVYRLAGALPAVYQEDDLSPRFVSAFDEELAFVRATLDNCEAYFDPWLAPADFVDWLASWVGMMLDETWPLDRRRALVARAVEFYRWRGTVRALSDQVELFTGVKPEIVESGGMTCAITPQSGLPGSPEPRLAVRLGVGDPSTIDLPRLRALVTAAKPAHVAADVEILPERQATT